MSIITKKGIMTAMVVTVLGAGAFVTTQSFAQSTADTPTPMSSLVKQIAQKFHLKEADVQAVFDSHRSEMKEQHQEMLDERLSKLVTDGKITDAQKQHILAKVKELEAKREATKENSKSMTPEERKASMEKDRTELEAWAKQNNIDLSYVRLGHGMGKGMRIMHRGNDDVSMPTPTTAQ